MPEAKKFLDIQGLALYDIRIKDWVEEQLEAFEPDIVTEEELNKIFNSPRAMYSNIIVENPDAVPYYCGYVALDNNGFFGVDDVVYLCLKTFSTENEEVVYSWLVAQEPTVSEIGEYSEDSCEAMDMGANITIVQGTSYESQGNTVYPIKLDCAAFTIFAEAQENS